MAPVGGEVAGDNRNNLYEIGPEYQIDTMTTFGDITAAIPGTVTLTCYKYSKPITIDLK